MWDGMVDTGMVWECGRGYIQIHVDVEVEEG